MWPVVRSLTQRGGLTWSSISADDYVVSYTAMANSASRGTVAQLMKDAVSMASSSGVTGRYGVLFESETGQTSDTCCKLSSSLDREHDFSVERSVNVGSYEYKSESKPTRLWLGFGGSQFWNGDRSSSDFGCHLPNFGGQWQQHSERWCGIVRRVLTSGNNVSVKADLILWSSRHFV